MGHTYYGSLPDSIATICKTVLPFSSLKKRRLPAILAAEQRLSKQQSDNLKWQQDSFHRMLNLMGLSKDGIVSEFQVSSFRSDLLEKLIASPIEHEPPLVLRDKLIFLQELFYTKCISEEEYHASKRPLLLRLAVQGAEINARDVIVGPQKEAPKDEWSVIDLKDEESLEALSTKKYSKENSTFKKIKGAVSVFGFVSPDKSKRPKENNVTYLGNKSNCSKENPFSYEHYSNKEENDSESILMAESLPVPPARVLAEKKQNVCEKAERKPFTAKALFFYGLMKWKKNELKYETTSFSVDETSNGASYGGKLIENPVAEGPNTKQIKRKLHPNGTPTDFFVDKVVGEKIKRELCRYPNVRLTDDEVEVISTRLPIDKTDLQRFFPKSWCDEYGDIVLDVVRKEFKEHMTEMGHSQKNKVAEKRKNICGDQNSNPNPFAPKDGSHFMKRTSLSSSNNAHAPLINTSMDKDLKYKPFFDV